MEHGRINRLVRTVPLQMMGLVVILALLLSACGGGAAPEPAATVAPTATEVVAAPTAEAPRSTATARPTPTEEEEEETEATEPTEAAADDTEVVNAGGFAFERPEGWAVSTNEGGPGFGTVMLTPTGVDPETADDQGIIMVFGPADIMLSGIDVSGGIDETTIDMLLNDMLSTPDGESADITISESEEVQIGDNDGFAVDISGSDPDLGTVQGRVALASLENGNALLIIGLGTEETWDQEQFDNILDTMRFFTPEETLPTVELPEVEAAPTEETTPGAGDDAATPGAGDVETNFPLPDDASGAITVPSDGSVNFQTGLSAEEVMDFYRAELTGDGATERELLTVLTDGTFSMVFDGWPDANGQAVVVQGTPLSDEELNVNIRLEDV